MYFAVLLDERFRANIYAGMTMRHVKDNIVHIESISRGAKMEPEMFTPKYGTITRGICYTYRVYVENYSNQFNVDRLFY